jgi:hypothetical protein
MMDDPTGRSYWTVIFLASVDLVCIFEAGDSVREGHYKAAILWFAVGTILSVIGYKWPQIKRNTAPRLFAPKLRPVWTALFLVCSLCVFQILVGPEFIVRLHQRWHGWIGYLIFASLGAILACGYWWLAGVMSKPADKAGTSPPPAADEKPPTLLDLFKKDFPGTLKASDKDVDAYTIGTPEGSTIKAKRQIYEDYEAKAKFIGFYISSPDPPPKDFSGQDTFAACMELLKHGSVQETFDHFGKQVAIMSGYGDQMTTSKELTFSGRVLIYHEEFLSIPQKADILKAYKEKGLAVTFRGSDYLGTQVIAWHQQHDSKAAH